MNNNLPGPMMNAEQITAYIAAKYPNSGQSPFALAVKSAIASDEADRAINFAQLQSVQSASADQQMYAEALEHARGCIDACKSNGADFDVDTLAFNLESNFPDLDVDDCEEIANLALEKTGDE